MLAKMIQRCLKHTMKKFKDMKTSTKCASVLTFLWFVGIVVVVWYSRCKPVINLATFVAVSCSIPTFVWLIIGHYRHGQELKKQEKNFRKQLTELQCQNKTLTKQNKVLSKQENVLGKQTQALKLQARHTKKLAKVAEKERQRVKLREERQAEPILIPQIEESVDSDIIKTKIINRGGEMRNIMFHHNKKNLLRWSPENFLGANDLALLSLIRVDQEVAYPLQFTVDCQDSAGYSHTFHFKRTRADVPWRQISHEKKRGTRDAR